MKNRSALFGKFAIVLFLFLTLAGCASIPLETSSYIKDLYKRVPYAVEGRYRVVNFFYATDRIIERRTDAPPSFKPELDNKLSYGQIDIKIDPAVKIGAMPPTTFKNRGLIGIENIRESEESEFIKNLSEAVKSSPHKSLLVMIFGYKDGFEFTAMKTAYSMYSLDVNTPVLLFDWPGDQPVSISGYLKAQSYAKLSGPQLGGLLTKIIRDVKPENLWIEGSSLGCQIVCDAFEDMHKYPEFADADLEIDHVVLAAPDVAQNEFDVRFKNELSALSKRLTVYVSSDDDALLMSGFLSNEKKLGRQKQKEGEQFGEAKELLYLKSLDPDKISLIDVTPIDNASFGHGYYLECPEFFDDFYQKLLDKTPNANRRLYLLKTKDNVDYWVLRGK